MSKYPKNPIAVRRPRWLPASSFYVLAVAVAIAVFFVSWQLLQEIGDETPWISAGLAASVVLFGAVVFRELLSRSAARRIPEPQTRLQRTLKSPALPSADRPDKLTIERNAAVLREIKQKSEAANVLNTLASAHREVFELCERYLGINSRELATIGNGSPRLAPLLKGKDLAESLHKYHLLSWAEAESRALGSDARSREKTTEKLKLARAALSIIESALEYYPEESKLNESRDALDEFIAAVRITDWIEKGQRAAFRGNYKQAKKHFNEALFFVGRHPNIHDHELAAAKISEELEKVVQIDA